MRVDITERRLKELVRQTWTIGDRSAPRGNAGAAEPEPALPTLDTAERSVDADQLDERWTPRLRGDGLLSLGTSALAASRALHRLLVEPIQRLLPPEPGSLLTIIPHGPRCSCSPSRRCRIRTASI